MRRRAWGVILLSVALGQLILACYFLIFQEALAGRIIGVVLQGTWIGLAIAGLRLIRSDPEPRRPSRARRTTR